MPSAGLQEVCPVLLVLRGLAVLPIKSSQDIWWAAVIFTASLFPFFVVVILGVFLVLFYVLFVFES